MVGHVYFRSAMSSLLDGVYVATCDREILDYIKSIGGQAVMTKETHKRASDRTAEALLKIEAKGGKKVDIVIMIQGDEPMITPQMIDQVVTPMIRDPTILVANLMTPLRSRTEHEDSNEVKVVVDRHNFALYFSREPIPSRKDEDKDIPMFKQVCIIPFRRDFLRTFNELEPTPLEIIESIDMLRVLEHGYQVKMIFTDERTYSVDTPQDLSHVNALMSNDELLNHYPKFKR